VGAFHVVFDDFGEPVEFVGRVGHVVDDVGEDEFPHAVAEFAGETEEEGGVNVALGSGRVAWSGFVHGLIDEGVWGWTYIT